jgi:hypothetical protein
VAADKEGKLDERGGQIGKLRLEIGVESGKIRQNEIQEQQDQGDRKADDDDRIRQGGLDRRRVRSMVLA